MIIDGFRPEGITMLTVDSIFMMPQLGVLSTVNQQAATEVFEKDCLIRLGTCVSPVGLGKTGSTCMTYEITLPNGEVKKGDLKFGEMQLIRCPLNKFASAKLNPARGFSLVALSGEVETKLEGGVVGIILDGRGRPLNLPADKQERIEAIQRWNKALELYPQ